MSAGLREVVRVNRGSIIRAELGGVTAAVTQSLKDMADLLVQPLLVLSLRPYERVSEARQQRHE
jgi:hypothetical protein